MNEEEYQKWKEQNSLFLERFVKELLKDNLQILAPYDEYHGSLIELHYNNELLTYDYLDNHHWGC